jgi:hypothetical protein
MAMALIGGDELRGLREKAAEAESLRAQVVELSGQLALYSAADQATAAARAALDGGDGLNIIDERAREGAQAAAFEAERDRLIEERKQKLLEENGPGWAQRYRAANEDNIVADLQQRLTEDGTFARMRREAEEGVRAGLRTTVIQSGQEQIAAEVAAETEVHRQAMLAEYLAGPMAARYREQSQAAAKREVAAMTPQLAREKLNDDALQAALAARIEQERAATEIENRARELAQSFQRGGIRVEEIPADASVVLWLGRIEIIDSTETYTDSHHNTRNRPKKIDAFRVARRLTLTALDDHRFVVDGDSLHDSRSPHDRKAALPIGAVISVGRRLEDKTAEPPVRLDGRLVSGVELYYDDDTRTTDDFESTGEGLLNVIIDGVKARDLPEVS